MEKAEEDMRRQREEEERKKMEIINARVAPLAIDGLSQCERGRYLPHAPTSPKRLDYQYHSYSHFIDKIMIVYQLMFLAFAYLRKNLFGQISVRVDSLLSVSDTIQVRIIFFSLNV